MVGLLFFLFRGGRPTLRSFSDVEIIIHAVASFSSEGLLSFWRLRLRFEGSLLFSCAAPFGFALTR